MIGEPLSVITKGLADVDTLLGEGVDPHLYRPTRSDIARLTRADVIVYTGLTLEAKLIPPIDQLQGRIPSVAIGERLGAALLLPYDNGPGDPHVWMDPSLWREGLSAAVEVIAREDPDNAETYRARADDYFAALEGLADYAETVMASVPADRRVLVTAHDAFGYFGRRFDIAVKGVQGISTESEAGLRAIEDLVSFIVDQDIPAVFVETSVSDRHVRALIDGAAARGHEVVIGGALFSDAMGPAGTYEGTYIGMIDHNATTIARALGGSVPDGGYQGRLAPADDP